jgi:hypothetical protein
MADETARQDDRIWFQPGEIGGLGRRQALIRFAAGAGDPAAERRTLGHWAVVALGSSAVLPLGWGARVTLGVCQLHPTGASQTLMMLLDDRRQTSRRGWVRWSASRLKRVRLVSQFALYVSQRAA